MWEADAKGQPGFLRKQTLLSVVVNALTPAEAGRISEIHVSLVYRASARTDRTTQRNPVMKIKQKSLRTIVSRPCLLNKKKYTLLKKVCVCLDGLAGKGACSQLTWDIRRGLTPTGCPLISTQEPTHQIDKVLQVGQAWGPLCLFSLGETGWLLPLESF